MAFTRSEETALIQTLYTSANQAGSNAWAPFLEHLANTTRADFAVLIIEENGQRIVSVSAQNAPIWLNTFLSADDPAGLGRMRYNRVYAHDDLPGIVPGTGNMLRVVRVPASAGQAWLLIQRDRDDFRALDASLLSLLAPHIETAHPIWSKLSRNSLDSELKQRLTNALSCGWVAFDRAGRVVDKDPHSEDLLSSLEPELIRKTIESQNAMSISMGDNGTIEVYLTPYIANLGPTQSAIACIALFRETQPVESPDPQKIAGTLDIALAEARLAASLAHGFSLAESADRLNLTIETARNYSKRIFAQTGLKGQPDLVRRVLNGIARFR